MLEIATPDVYRFNAFRVLGVGVNVSGSDLTRQQKRMKMLAKLDANVLRAEASILPLDPPPDADAVRRAGQRLRQPESRIVDELLWLWPVDHHDSEGDKGLRLMRQGDLRGAHRLWCQLEQDKKHGSVAGHNLAVLHHAIALDMEHAMEGHKRLDPKSDARRNKHWQVALEHWASVAKDNVVWDRVADRIRELDDPRLTTGSARRLRRVVPDVILTISIRLAVGSAKQGDTHTARRHLGYVHDSGFPPSLAESILDREVTPLVDQIKQICEPVPARSEADPEHADALARQLMTDTRPLLAAICAVVDRDHHLRQSASDAVATNVRESTIEYGKKTKNWAPCAELLKEALDIAVDDGLRGLLQEEISQVETNLRQEREYEKLKSAVAGNRVYEVTLTTGSAYRELAGKLGVLNVPGDRGGFRATVPAVCACCLGKADGKQRVGYQWEQTRGLTRYKRSLSFAFPICGACRQHQAEYSRKRWLLVLLAAGASTAIAYLLASQMKGGQWLPLVLAGGVLTSILLLVCSSFVRLRVLPEAHACRDAAVEMSSASDTDVTFRFHNPLYADAFAKANDATVKSHPYAKAPRGSYLLRGNAAVFPVLASLILGAIGHSIVYGGMHHEWKRKSSVTRRDYRPQSTENARGTPASDGYSPSPPSPSGYRYTGLSARIESGKARVKSLESEIERMTARLEMLASVLKLYRGQIDDFKRQLSLGQQVDQAAYELAIKNHKFTVRQRMSLLTDRNAKYDECTREIDSVKDMVRRFNSGQR